MSQPIYRLCLQWQPDPAAKGFQRFKLETLIDGVPLLELVRNWEAEHVSERDRPIAGAYTELYGWHAGLLRGWLGEPLPETEYSHASGKVALFSCSCCGIVDCWPLLVRVTLTGDAAIWSDFLQPFRGDSWSYEGFGPFVFDRAEYEVEVRQAIADVPVVATQNDEAQPLPDFAVVRLLSDAYDGIPVGVLGVVIDHHRDGWVEVDFSEATEGAVMSAAVSLADLAIAEEMSSADSQ